MTALDINNTLLYNSNFEADVAAAGDATITFENVSLHMSGTSVAAARVSALTCKYNIYTSQRIFQITKPTPLLRFGIITKN